MGASCGRVRALQVLRARGGGGCGAQERSPARLQVDRHQTMGAAEPRCRSSDYNNCSPLGGECDRKEEAQGKRRQQQQQQQQQQRRDARSQSAARLPRGRITPLPPAASVHGPERSLCVDVADAGPPCVTADPCVMSGKSEGTSKRPRGTGERGI
ncbi:hypothetical protein FQA47_007883 [Oryzias melastigma]|uniref:Uncharacterized protein n=1 Tax=Oryzias melastigma TaxID=30732 RepID=A0A834CIP9_ORYME|nr:hypothetical protein FQA47_007883 [Oryzias melastigma]